VGQYESSERQAENKLKVNDADSSLILFRTSALSSLVAKKHHKTGKFALVKDTADEVDQAFTSPIWDQNGNIVRYEIRMNKPTVDYIVTNELYNIEGQVKFSESKKQ